MIAPRKSVVIHTRNRVSLCVAPAACAYAAVHDAQIRVWHDQVRVNEQAHTKSRTGRARAIGIIKREQTRGQLVYRDAAVLTGIILREAELSVLTDEVNRQKSAGKRHCSLGRVRKAAGDIRLYDQTVNDYLYNMLFVFLELDFLGQVVHYPVHADTDVARLLCVLKYFHMLALAGAHDRRHELYARPLRERHYLVNYLVNALLPYFPAAFRAVRHTDTRPEQTKIIIYLGDCAYRGARVL